MNPCLKTSLGSSNVRTDPGLQHPKRAGLNVNQQLSLVGHFLCALWQSLKTCTGLISKQSKLPTWGNLNQASFLAQWRYQYCSQQSVNKFQIRNMTKIKHICLSLDEDHVSTLCQRRWSSSAWRPPTSPLPRLSPSQRSPPLTLASFSTGWTPLTCTQEARYSDELWFLIIFCHSSNLSENMAHTV